jgi:predicted short-subunit dehydrogenase-like oxidoreductase (DUF2520 family)
MEKPTIAVIGPGRAGSALARGLGAAGYRVAAVQGRHPENAERLAQELGARTTRTAAGALELADLTILAVPDGAIAPLSRELADSICNAGGKSAVHLSGAQDRAPLGPLATMGVRTGVFHPLQTFARRPESAANLRGSAVGIEAGPPLDAVLNRMALDLGGEPFSLNGVDRARYHAAAVLAANYPITLLVEAERLMAGSGVDPEVAHRGLLALLRGAVSNLNGSRPREALTGPAARGDTETVRRHLDSLVGDPELEQIYRLLAGRTTRLAKEGE